jgi:hypothetical protein
MPPSLEEYGRRVAEFETAERPATVEKINALVNSICGAAWETAEERERAQGLVARLERLKHSAQDRLADNDERD